MRFPRNCRQATLRISVTISSSRQMSSHAHRMRSEVPRLLSSQEMISKIGGVIRSIFDADGNTANEAESDPMLICSSFKKNRFYVRLESSLHQSENRVLQDCMCQY